MRELAFSGRVRKSRTDAKSGGSLWTWSLHLWGHTFSSSTIYPSARPADRASTAAVRGFISTPNQRANKKCKFRQLPLWALTSQGSFSLRPHPGSDFPTSAIIYWQDLFLFLTLKELPSTILNKAPRGSTQWTESPFPHGTSPAPGNVFPSIVSHFWRHWQHKSSPDISHCPSVIPKQRQGPQSPQGDPGGRLRPHSIFPWCLAARNLFEMFIPSVTRMLIQKYVGFKFPCCPKCHKITQSIAFYVLDKVMISSQDITIIIIPRELGGMA